MSQPVPNPEVPNATDASASLGRGGRPKRVALWIDEMNSDLLEALRAENVEVVALLQASHPDVPSFSIHDLFYVASSITSLSTVTAPAHWIDDASFRLYARCVQRVGFYPASDFLESASGGVMLGSDVEDWARVHLTGALRVLEGVAADEVWFCFNPHLGVDNMLALAAHHTGRKCLVFTQIRFAPKFSWKQLGIESPTSTINADWKPWNAGAVPPNLFYMRIEQPTKLNADLLRRFRFLIQRFVRADWSALSSRLYQGARKRRWWSFMYLLEMLDRRTRGWAAHRLHFRRRFAGVRRSRREVNPDTDFGNFIYFPLHLEPEENVHVLGGKYTNQLDAVVALHDALPTGWTIVLKENPIQTFQNRGEPFDQRLSELANVCFVHESYPSSTLIEHARLVATITGTASYEALLKGKPSLYFGDAWFAGLPGATLFAPDIDMELLSRMHVPREALDSAMNKMLSGLADGLAHPRYAIIHGVTHDLPTLYREAARSMAAISAGSASVPADASDFPDANVTSGVEFKSTNGVTQ